MIGVPGNVRVYLACGVTDMRRGFDGLAAQVQTMPQLDPHGGAVFAFRGRRGDLVKLLWWDGQGLCLFCQAPGAWPVCMAAGEGWFGIAHGSAALDALGGNRLAGAAAHLVATGSLLIGAAK